jgi:CRP/FNR family transcriptional regulator
VIGIGDGMTTVLLDMMSCAGTFDTLRAIPLFASLSDEELTAIMERFTIRKYRENDVILWQRETNDCMYIVLDGRVKAFRVSEEGVQTVLAIHGKGDFFGEMSLLDGRTSPANVAAMEDSVVALIRRDAFLGIIYENHRIIDNLVYTLCTRLRAAWDRVQMVNVAGPERIKALFQVILSQHSAACDDGVWIDLRLRPEHMAEMTGLKNEAVRAILDAWVKEGNIRCNGRKTLLTKRFLREQLGIG